MRDDAQDGEHEWEAIDYAEENLCSNNAIDHSGKKPLCDDGVFFNKFGEVVQSRSYSTLAHGNRNCTQHKYNTYRSQG